MTTIDTHEFQPAGMESSPEEESLYRFRKGSYILYITLAAESRLLKIDYGFPVAIRRLLPSTLDTTYNHADPLSTITCY
jgi:hypothetical protein